MLFANSCHRAYVHAKETGDFRAAARLMKAAGASLDEALMLLLGIHQRPWRNHVSKSLSLGNSTAILSSVG